MSGYVQRKINLTLKIAQGAANPPTQFETIKLSGFRCAVVVEKGGVGSMGTAQIRISGMRLSDMNKVSTIGLLEIRDRRDSVSIEVGDDKNGMGLLYEGTIGEAWAELDGAPDVALNIMAYIGLRDAGLDAVPLSFTGPTDIVTIMSGLATRLGYQFENNGVHGIILSTPYFPGSPRDQIKAAAAAADIGWDIVDQNTLAIWPKGSGRGTSIPLISPSTGMEGYPGFTANGVVLRMIYNPSVVWFGTVKVESIVTPAAGTWIVRRVVHSLESETPGGQWLTEIEAARPGIVLARERN